MCTVLVLFWLLLRHVVLRLGITPVPQQWQRWIHNLLCHQGTSVYSILFVFFFFFLVIFLGLHLRHMEVPRLGAESELQLPAYATATATWDPSHVCDLHHSSCQCQILNHWVRPGIKLASSWILVGFVNRWAMTGTPSVYSLWVDICSHFSWVDT